MQRRALLLVTLFVLTAWFYAAVARESGVNLAQKQHEQVQLLNELDEVFFSQASTAPDHDGG